MVKVADVGVAKHENTESGAICSTSIYVAPEVFENRKQIYNSQADMYSFGYVLWELWYGETALRAAIDSRTEYQVLEDVMKQNLRPTHIEGTRHPWRNWQHVMTSCWNKDPKLRLTAQKGWEQLQSPEDFQESISPRSRPTKPLSLSPPPLPPKPSTLSRPSLPPKPSSLRQEFPTKPKPDWPSKPKGTPVLYHRETDGNVHFE